MLCRPQVCLMLLLPFTITSHQITRLRNLTVGSVITLALGSILQPFSLLATRLQRQWSIVLRQRVGRQLTNYAVSLLSISSATGAPLPTIGFRMRRMTSPTVSLSRCNRFLRYNWQDTSPAHLVSVALGIGFR